MSVEQTPSFWDRTLRNLRGAWQDVADSVFSPSPQNLRPDLPDPDAEVVRSQMRDCLSRRGGEVSARARAAALGRAYLSLSPAGRSRFLRILAADFSVDRERLDRAIAAYQSTEDDAEQRKARRELRAALDPPRRRLLTQFNGLPEGVKFLVDLRAELMPLASHDPALSDLERDLKELLTSWFDVGFLELHRITWETPAAILEKLIAYEAVHEIKSWDDLKNRLDSDRRCFAFFHPRMPVEPLIFVEVALTNGIADSVQRLLDETAPAEDPKNADTANFYSISNAQRGLDGIGFGGFLIKRVVDQLSEEFPKLKNYSTLSPIPGFRRWLDEQIRTGEEVLLPAEAKALNGTGANGAHPLEAVLSKPGWYRNDTAKLVAKPLTRLCARYLLTAKRGDGKALDPVANFHLSNGARVEQINWLADTSSNGMEQSAGLMINYVYRVNDIAANHEAYTGEGKITASSSVRGLAKG